MVDAGADALVLHLGLTTSGMIGAKTALTLEQGMAMLVRLREAAVAANPDVMVICHGGPIAGPQEVARVFAEVPGIQGFLGASSMERLPTEVALVDHMRRFTGLPMAPQPRRGRA